MLLGTVSTPHREAKVLWGVRLKWTVMTAFPQLRVEEGEEQVFSEGWNNSVTLGWALSCPVGASLVGMSHRRCRNRVNANELWWKASPRVARAEHTFTDYCTINHPSVKASVFIIITPNRHPNCAFAVINLGLEREQGGSKVTTTYQQGGVEKC